MLKPLALLFFVLAAASAFAAPEATPTVTDQLQAMIQLDHELAAQLKSNAQASSVDYLEDLPLGAKQGETGSIPPAPTEKAE